MKILTNKKIECIKALKFTEESFDKFETEENYKDRKHEMWHDRGYNNAIDAVLQELNISI